MRTLLLLFVALILQACANAPELTQCGWAYSVEVTPIGRNIYPLRVEAINGQNVNERPLRDLPPGHYDLKVYELIDDSRLNALGRQRGRSQNLALDIDAGQIYYLGAEFLPEQRYSSQNDYWRPVVWKQEARRCP